MSSFQVTAFKFAGHLFPEETLNQLLLNSTAFSCAFASKTKSGQPCVSVLRKMLKDMPDQLKGLLELQNKLKDKDVFLFFDNVPEDFDVKLLQPFELTFNSENKATVVAMVEGAEDSALYVKNYLQPKVLETMEAAKHDIAAFDKKVHGEEGKPNIFMNDVINNHPNPDKDPRVTLFMGNNSFLFMARNGATVPPDEEHGWLSREPVPEDRPITSDGNASEQSLEDELENILGGGAEAPAPEPEPEPVNKPSATPDVPKTASGRGGFKAPNIASTTPIKTGHPQGGTPDEEYVREQPNKNLREKEFNAWLFKREKNPDPKTQSWRAYQDYCKGKGDFFVMVKKEKTTVHKDMKDALKSSTAPAPTQPEPKKVEEPPSHVLPAEVKQRFTEDFLTKNNRTVGLVDVNSEAIEDERFLEKQKEGQPPIWSELGLPNLAATYHWHLPDAKVLMGKEYGDTLPLLWVWTKHALVEAQKELHQLKKSTKWTVPKEQSKTAVASGGGGQSYSFKAPGSRR